MSVFWGSRVCEGLWRALEDWRTVCTVCVTVGVCPRGFRVSLWGLGGDVFRDCCLRGRKGLRGGQSTWWHVLALWGYGRGRAGVSWRRGTSAGQVRARMQRADTGPRCTRVLGCRCVPTGLHVALCSRVFRSRRLCVLYLQTGGGDGRGGPSLALSQALGLLGFRRTFCPGTPAAAASAPKGGAWLREAGRGR